MKTLSLPALCRAGLQFLFLVLFWTLSSQPMGAAIRTWDGDASANNNWNVPGNWAEGVIPANGDDVIFPSGPVAADLLSTNNIVNLRLNSISFNGATAGYFLRGNSLTLSNGITAAQAAGINTIDLDLTLGRAQTFLVSDAQGILTVNGDIALNGFDLTVNAAGTNNLNGVISGTGDIAKNGTGRLVIGGLNSSPNTFVGETRLNAGTLQLSRATLVSVMPIIFEGRVSVPGNLFVGDGAGADLVVETFENQIADTATVTIADTATFQLDDVSDGITALIMNGGTVATGTGTLTNGNITTTASATTATITGNLHLGNFTRTFDVADGGASTDLSILADISGGSSGVFPSLSHAGIVKNGTGRLQLVGANTYLGPTTINTGLVVVGSDTALGGTSAIGSSFPGTTINPNGQLTVVSAEIGNETLIVNRAGPSAALTGSGVCSWSGPITLNSNAVFATGNTFALSNVISGAGGLELIGGTFRFAGASANTFDGDVIVHDGTLELAKQPGGSGNLAIPHDLTIGEPGDSGSTKTVRYLGVAEMDGAVTINCGGVLDLNNNNDAITGVTMSGGTITTGTGTLSINGNLTVLAELSPCDDNIINGNLTFLFGPRFINMPVGSIAIGAPDLTINAVVSSATPLSITGNSGRVFLNGANTFSGLLRLESTSGDLVVRLSNPSALGGITAGTILDGIQLELAGFVFADEPLTNINAGTIIRTFGNNNHGGPIVLNADVLVTNTAAITEFAGPITGAGDMRKTGTGTLRFSGGTANNFGTMFVNQGLLEMNKTALLNAATPLVIGDGVNTATARSLQDSQTDGVTVNFNSLWDLNGNNDAISPLVLNDGGDVTTGVGTLTFSTVGSITVGGGPFGLTGSASVISGNLNLGSSGTRTINVAERATLIIGGDNTELIINAIVSGAAGFNKTGAGDMSLNAANTFTGNAAVSDGELLITDNAALGTTAGTTTVSGDAQLGISGDITVTGESLILNTAGQGSEGAIRNSGGTNTWTGPVSLTRTAVINVLTNTALVFSGVISGGGGITKIGPGRLEYSGAGANTYAGTTTLNEGVLECRKSASDGAIPGRLIVGDGVGGAAADVLRTIGPASGQVNDTADVTINSSGRWEISVGETIGGLEGSGQLDLGSSLLFGDEVNRVFDGVISGTASSALSKAGAGTVSFNANNSYAGPTTVLGGTLLVNANQPSSDVTVNSSATLGGTGQVGDLHVNNLGNLAPGTSPGQFTSQNTKLDPGSNLRVELNSAVADIGYDQLRVFGTLDLNGAQLLVTKSPGYAPVDGSVHTIIENDGVDAITGTFGGRPEGSIVTLNQIDFRLSYVGGTGNDVTLTVTNIPLRFASSRVEAGNGNGRVDPNECDHLFVALENRGAGTISGITARLDSLTPGVAITQPDSAYPNIPALGFGTNTTPFQIRISPDFLCGQNVELSLAVSATGEGTFAVPVTLNSGAPGAFTTFNSTNIPKAIPDLGTTNSIIIVTNQFRVGKVRVSIHATHPAAGDLRFRLRSPLGTEVLLVANRGGNVPNYGNSCAVRTTFDDAAATKITAGTAPFAGTFAPEGSLADFIGEPAGNGTWRLSVDDTVAGDTGTLQCWSLFLAPASCADGGGECASCLATVAGTLTPASPIMPERTSRTFQPSGCGNVKLCPGSTVSLLSITAYRYGAHTFTNTGPETCVTVVLTVPCTDATNALISAAYLDPFLPSDLCANYLGDSGSDIAGGSGGYSFRVPAGAHFVVMVHELNPEAAGQGCGNYTLQLYGLPCPPPTLHISHVDTPPNRVRLFWSTAYPDFQLQRSASLNGVPPFPFANVPTLPVVIGGDYNVTNSATANDDYFRLRQP